MKDEDDTLGTTGGLLPAEAPPEETDKGEFVNSFAPQRRRIQGSVHSAGYVRSILARYMLYLIGGLSGLIVISTITGCLSIEKAKALAGIVVGPLFGIFATIVGFFFGESQRGGD